MCNYTKFSLSLAEVILTLCAMLVLPAHLNQRISWGVFNNLFKLGFKRRVMPRTAMQGLTGRTGNILKRSCENNKSWIKLVVIVNLQSSALFGLCAQVPGCAIIKCLGLPPQALQSFGCSSNFHLRIGLLCYLSSHLQVNLEVCSQEQWKKSWVMQLSEGDLHFKSEYIVTGSMREKR